MSNIVIGFCWIGIHNWTNWKDATDKDCHTVQYRQCENCGKKKYLKGIARHQWSKWGDEDVISVWGHDGAERPIYKFLLQRRTCSKCGRIETRKAKLS
jgi:hypothetical protein